MSRMREMCVIARREFLERVQLEVVRRHDDALADRSWSRMIVVPALLGGQRHRGREGRDHRSVRGELGDAARRSTLGAALKWNATRRPARHRREVELRPDPRRTRSTATSIDPRGRARRRRDRLPRRQREQPDRHDHVRAGGHAGSCRRRARERVGLSETQLARCSTAGRRRRRGTRPARPRAASGIFTFLIGYMLAFILYIVITLYGVDVMRSVVTEKTSRVDRAAGRGDQAARDDGRQDPRRRRAPASSRSRSGSCSARSRSPIADDDPRRCSASSGERRRLLPSLASPQLARRDRCASCSATCSIRAMYAAVGAMVSSEQDTQQAQMPVTILLVIGMRRDHSRHQRSARPDRDAS